MCYERRFHPRSAVGMDCQTTFLLSIFPCYSPPLSPEGLPSVCKTGPKISACVTRASQTWLCCLSIVSHLPRALKLYPLAIQILQLRYLIVWLVLWALCICTHPSIPQDLASPCSFPLSHKPSLSAVPLNLYPKLYYLPLHEYNLVFRGGADYLIYHCSPRL